MKEDFLHFIWRTRNFEFRNLHTTDGRSVAIVDFGQYNRDAGPDFKHARLEIDETLWAGHVEMHLTASEWDRHKHTDDPNYHNVILHVVLEEDTHVFIGDRRLPCVELKGRIPADVLARYRRLIQLQSWVPCQHHLAGVPPLHKSDWLQRMLVERLETKAADVWQHLDDTGNDWEEVLYRLLARSFGFKVNGPAFEQLARVLPVRTIYHLGANTHQIEALLFGCAGLLNRIFIDDYGAGLQREFAHLERKYGLMPIAGQTWQWGRLRPANFPTVRIAQFTALMARGQSLLAEICAADGLPTLRKILDVSASEYWLSHSDFDRPGGKRSGRLGKQAIEGILINTIVPFLFIYGKHREDLHMTERALDFMGDIAAESNRITRGWEQIGMPNAHAGQSQALLHLKREYCDAHRCTQCAIGSYILLADNGE